MASKPNSTRKKMKKMTKIENYSENLRKNLKQNIQTLNGDVENNYTKDKLN